MFILYIFSDKTLIPTKENVGLYQKKLLLYTFNMSIISSIVNWDEIETMEDRNLGEIARDVLEEAKNESGKGQALGNAFVKHCLLSYNDYQKGTIDRKQYISMVGTAAEILFGNYTRDEMGSMNRGFLGEVCLINALSELQMEVLLPSQEDDIAGKIDLWASDKEGNLLAIQVKSKITTNEIHTYDSDTIEWKVEDIGVDFERMIEYCTEKRDQIIKKFKSATNEGREVKITPLVIVIPSEENWSNPSHVKGIPMKQVFRYFGREMDFSAALWEEIEPILYSEERW